MSTSALGNVFVFVLTFALSHHKSSGPDFNLTLRSGEGSLSSRPLCCGRGSSCLASAQEEKEGEGGGVERDDCSFRRPIWGPLRRPWPLSLQVLPGCLLSAFPPESAVRLLETVSQSPTSIGNHDVGTRLTPRPPALPRPGAAVGALAQSVSH